MRLRSRSLCRFALTASGLRQSRGLARWILVGSIGLDIGDDVRCALSFARMSAEAAIHRFSTGPKIRLPKTGFDI